MSSLALTSTDPRLDAFIAEAMERLEHLLPTVEFGECAWSTAGRAPSTATATPTIYFTCRGSCDSPLPNQFSTIVKAWTVLGGGTPSRWSMRAHAARWLWEAVDERFHGEGSTVFTWRAVSHNDFVRAEQRMIEEGLAPRTIYKLGSTLSDLAYVLSARGVIAPIRYTPITPRVSDSSTVRVAEPAGPENGMLTPAALAAIADVFARATTIQDQFWSSVIALMVATGVRWSEVVTLPLNPLESVDVELRDSAYEPISHEFTRLRRHKSKSKRAGGEGQKSEETQWLTPAQAELAALAIERLTAITETARATARSLEASEGRWRWPGRRPRHVYAEHLVRVLGVPHDTANWILRQIGQVAPATGRGGNPRRRCTVAAAEDYMTHRQHWNALTVVRASRGRAAQLASDSLLCIRANELHEGWSALPLIARPTWNMLATWLHGKGAAHENVFARFERIFGVRYREPDGSLVEITSHMARRFFVTMGLRAGATRVDIARWQGREDVTEIRAYDKRTTAELVALVKDQIRSNQMRGTVQEVYVALADEVRDEWLDAHLQTVHVTPLGLCVHDFAVLPCPLALNCLKGCKDYLVDATDESQRFELVQLERRTAEVLERTAQEGATQRTAVAWLTEQEATLRNVREVLASINTSTGEPARPFNGAGTRFQRLAGA